MQVFAPPKDHPLKRKSHPEGWLEITTYGGIAKE
jgi:hypothetical protein